MSQLFASVIPVLRTPPGVDVFDYALPPEINLWRGDLVRIPFRRSNVIGVVDAVKMTTAIHQTKTLLGSYGGYFIPEPMIDLAKHTATRQFVSTPNILQAWIRHAPKRPAPYVGTRRETSAGKNGSYREHWTSEPETALLARARQLLKYERRLLILTPWIARAKRWQTVIPTSLALHSELAAGAAFQAWTDWLSGKIPCLIATRLGAWLTPAAGHVLLDEPEQDDYKQDELTPRYDARQLVKWSIEHAPVRVEAFGLTPPLRCFQRTEPVTAPSLRIPLRIIIRQPGGRSKIPLIQADTLNLLITHTGPRVIIHPIRGLQARLVCRDCGFRAVCASCGFGLSQDADHLTCRHCGTRAPTILSCPQCAGADLGKSWPGIERIRSAWEKYEPRCEIEWRDLTSEATDRPFPRHALVVVTDGALLGSFGEDVRREEQRVLAFRRLAERVKLSQASLAIQSGEQLAGLWETWLDGQGFLTYWKGVFHERELFGYPPGRRLVKIIVSGGREQALELKQRLEQNLTHALGSAAKLDEPLDIPFQSAGRRPRQLLQLTTPLGVSERALIDYLTPFAKSAIIDLDPVSFFH